MTAQSGKRLQRIRETTTVFALLNYREDVVLLAATVTKPPHRHRGLH
jgi:hypothetical protein